MIRHRQYDANSYLPSELHQLGWDILGSASSIRDDGGALDLAISFAQGSFVGTQLARFPGQHGLRKSTAWSCYLYILQASHVCRSIVSRTSKQFYPESSELISSSHMGPEPTPPDHSEEPDASIP